MASSSSSVTFFGPDRSVSWLCIGDGETRFGEHLAGGLLEGHLVAVERDESSIGDDLDEASSPGPERIRDTVPAEDHEREERAVLGLDLELLEFREC